MLPSATCSALHLSGMAMLISFTVCATSPADHCRGNMGAGLTHLIMPYIFSGMADLHPDFIAWRCAYFIPGFAQVSFTFTPPLVLCGCWDLAASAAPTSSPARHTGGRFVSRLLCSGAAHRYVCAPQLCVRASAHARLHNLHCPQPQRASSYR